MGKRLLVILLSIAMGLEPFALYPTLAFANEPLNPIPVQKTPIQTILEKVVNAKTAYVRNKIYGETPGADAALVPSASQIHALEKELQDLKVQLFADIKASLYRPKPDASLMEWEQILAFYKAAAELEDLKVLNGSYPNPSTWPKLYGLDLPLSDINNMGFIFMLGQHVRNLPLERQTETDGQEKTSIHNIGVVVQLHDRGLGQGMFEFRLNPLLAYSFAEKAMVATVSQYKMLQLAQLIAANQLYETSALLNMLNKRDLSELPEISPALKSKFPILEWKRANFLMVQKMNDQRDIIFDLVERKIGALIEKVNKEGRNFMDMETVEKTTRALNRFGALSLNPQELKNSLDDQLEAEKGLPFLLALRSVMSSMAFDPAKSREFWSYNIKTAITQAKLMVILDANLNLPQDVLTEASRQKVRQILLERAAVYQQVVLKDFDVNLVLKYIKDLPTLYAQRRQRFQRDLWIKAKNMEDELTVQNSRVDLTIIADPDFVSLLNAQVNKETKEYTVNVSDENGVNTEVKRTKTLTRNIQPITQGWLENIFQPGQTYAMMRANYLKVIYSALADFADSPGQAPLKGSDGAFGTNAAPKTKDIKEWLLKSTYKNDLNFIDKDPLNYLALDLKNKAPMNRKQELIELIKIGENLGFFAEKSLGDHPLVNAMPWGAEWAKAYTTVYRKRIIAKNPILAVKLSDSAKEMWYQSILSTSASALAWTLHQFGIGGGNKKEKIFAEELAPLYNSNDPLSTTDDRADALVTTYLAKVQELVDANLQYLTTVDEDQNNVNWANPLTYGRMFTTNPHPEFSTQFKRIVTYSMLMSANVNQYARFQMLFQQMHDSFSAGDVWGKAYDRLYSVYVGDIFMATVGLSVMKWLTKFKTKKFHDLLVYFETEALVPVLGPGLKYFNYSALIWLAGHGAYAGIETFGNERSLRNRVNDFALATVDGPGLIEMNMKDRSDQVYNDAHLNWWLEHGLMFGIFAGFVVGLGGYSILSPGRRLKKFTAWGDRILKAADDVGMQETKDGKAYISLLEGDIDGHAKASLSNVKDLIAKGNAKPNGPRWANSGYVQARIESARSFLHAEREKLIREWTEYGKRFANHFRALRMEPGQWDVQVLNLRKIEIEEAFHKHKTITEEQYLVLKEYHRELNDFFKRFIDIALKKPEVGGPVLELLSTVAARLEFNPVTGAIVSHSRSKAPLHWVREAKKFNSDYDKGMSDYFRARAGELGLKYDRKSGVNYVRRVNDYNMDVRKQDYLKSLEKAQ